MNFFRLITDPVPQSLANRMEILVCVLRRGVLVIALYLLGPPIFSSAALAQEVIIINRDVSIEYLSNNAVRAIFGMRLRTWPDKTPIKVFVLGDRDPAHANFTKQVLSIFPHQLRRAWDRQVFSGTAQAPNEVRSIEAMLSAVSSTPGAIGYLPAGLVDDNVRVVEVQ